MTREGPTSPPPPSPANVAISSTPTPVTLSVPSVPRLAWPAVAEARPDVALVSLDEPPARLAPRPTTLPPPRPLVGRKGGGGTFAFRGVSMLFLCQGDRLGGFTWGRGDGDGSGVDVRARAARQDGAAKCARAAPRDGAAVRARTARHGGAVARCGGAPTGLSGSVSPGGTPSWVSRQLAEVAGCSVSCTPWQNVIGCVCSGGTSRQGGCTCSSSTLRGAAARTRAARHNVPAVYARLACRGGPAVLSQNHRFCCF